jgi:energy-coupling factor transport system permease protein
MTVLLSTRNPVYLLLAFCCLLTTGAVIARKKNQPHWLANNLRFLMTMLFLSSLINTLFTHSGNTVLFTLPENWLLIGGEFTLESLIFGLINGLVIGSLYITFNVLNLALSVKQMRLLIPTIFHPITLTITIALTFFPSIQKRAREIKEAQMIRGNEMKRISDWLPLLLPLLITSLENAFLLSESMSSRGFHIQQKLIPYEVTLISVIIATFSVFSGWILRLYGYPDWVSLLLYSLGGLILGATIIAGNRKVKITHYKASNLQKKDVRATIAFSVLIAVWVFLRLSSLFPQFSYTPYPELSPPPIHLAGIIFSLMPALPIIFMKNDQI